MTKRNKINKMNKMNKMTKRNKRKRTRKHKGGEAPVQFPPGNQPSEQIMQWATTAGRR